jgi:hypothetical protein
MSKMLNAFMSAGRLKLVSWLERRWRKARPVRFVGKLRLVSRLFSRIQADQICKSAGRFKFVRLVEEEIEHVQVSSCPPAA